METAQKRMSNMPQNKLQDLVFSAIMVVVMVYFMTLYNISLEAGFSPATLGTALLAMWPEAAAAFL